MPDEPEKPEPLKKLSELVDVEDPKERVRHLLRIQDGLLAAAVKKGDFKATQEIMSEAQRLLRQCS